MRWRTEHADNHPPGLPSLVGGNVPRVQVDLFFYALNAAVG